jgi:hypothetical protein
MQAWTIMISPCARETAVYSRGKAWQRLGDVSPDSASLHRLLLWHLNKSRLWIFTRHSLASGKVF